MLSTGGRFVMVGLVFGISLGLSGCFGKANDVAISGNDFEVRIAAPSGYDTLDVAKGHCQSYKKKAIFNGRGEGRSGVMVTNFKCMLR